MIKILSIAALTVLVSSCASVENILGSIDNQYPTEKTIATNAKKGLVTIQSNHSVKDTADKIVSIIEAKGMTVFARVDHQQNASGANLTLRPTQVIMFGNPKAGTPLMQCEQTVAIDLPQKILISEDADNTVWLSYNDPEYLKTRHNIQGCDNVINTISMALDNISKAAIAQ